MFGVWCLVCVWCLMFGVWCLTFGVWCSGLWFGVWCLVFDGWCLVLGVWGFECRVGRHRVDVTEIVQQNVDLPGR